MQFLEQEILEIAEATWQSIVGMQVSSGGETATMPSPEGFLTGSVEISGAWNGSCAYARCGTSHSRSRSRHFRFQRG